LLVVRPGELFLTSIDKDASVEQRVYASKFLDLVKDYGEVWSEMTLSMQNDAKSLFSVELERLNLLGLLVFGGIIKHSVNHASLSHAIKTSVLSVLRRDSKLIIPAICFEDLNEQLELAH
jgi:hypothetical protein